MTQMKQPEDYLAFIEEILELNENYIQKFITLAVKYNRSETLELADEYMDKYNEIMDKLKKK